MDKNPEQQESLDADPIEDNMDEDEASKAKLTSGDPNKVQFTSVAVDDGKNGEARVDIVRMAPVSVGMGKEELMKYANEPFWVNLRLFLFVGFWVLWVAMLVGAVVIIVMAPRCPAPPTIEWHQKTAFYQADIKTFKDSDGDGYGDINGLITKLDYLKSINFGALMLSSFFKSSDSEGESILDHKDIDPHVGTLEDFEKLVASLKEKDMKLVVDFVPNHSSDQHPWFEKSVENQEPYNDFYVWADSSSGGKPPNNWVNARGESAWVYNAARGKYYLCTFGEDKPDLNLRNALVRQELKEILEFWLQKGVDGFKVVAASHLIEDKTLRDEPTRPAGQSDTKSQHGNVNHLYTVDQPENIGLFAEWREMLKNFTTSTGVYKILVPEVSGSLNTTALYFGNETHPLADFPYGPELTMLNSSSTGRDIERHLEDPKRHLPLGAWPALVLGNKRVSRLSSRVGHHLVDGVHMIVAIARGTPISYYGDEIGMDDFRTSDNRLGQSVMLWDNSSSAGFTNKSTPFPVHPSYETTNVAAQLKDKKSHLSILSQLLKLRDQPAVKFGVTEYPVVSDQVFTLLRVRKGFPGYLVVVNLGTNSTTLDLSKKSVYLPEMARLEIRSSNVETGPLSAGDHPKIALNEVPLQGKQSAVFSFVPVFEG